MRTVVYSVLFVALTLSYNTNSAAPVNAHAQIRSLTESVKVGKPIKVVFDDQILSDQTKITPALTTTILAETNVIESENHKSMNFNCIVNDIVKAIIGLLLGVMGTSGIAIAYTVYTKGKKFKQMELAISIRDKEIAQLTRRINYEPLNTVDP
jgi:hypothetical protein